MSETVLAELIVEIVKENEEQEENMSETCDETNVENIENVNYYQIYYNWTSDPRLLSHTTNEFHNKQLSNNFLKGCKWSPDGSCLMTNSEDHCLRLFNLPQVLTQTPIVFNQQIEQMDSVLKIKESELIYDYCWYPNMKSTDPTTCLLLSTSRDNPIHMFDAYSGKLLCTYRAYNYADEVIAANSVSFNLDGSKIYSGYEKSIRIFDTSIPGRNCETKLTFDKTGGQNGIISCIAINPFHTNIFAVGSYDKSIGIYDETSLDNLYIMIGHKGGLTHLKFSSDGNRLYSGGRKDSEILCWDVRNTGKFLHAFNREVNTNQRIYFDLSPDSEYLVTGDDNGFVSVYETSGTDSSSDETLKPIKSFKAHQNCVNGVNFHPTLPLLSSCSGERKSIQVSDSDDSDDEHMFCLNRDFENCVKLWSIWQ